VRGRRDASARHPTEWTQFTPSAKRQCDEEANTDNTPSNVELLTCLEMERDVKTEPGGKMSK
jgi:hypothetical protein